jgi:hypothetical protein
VPGSLDKIEEEDAIFCLTKDGIFFSHSCLTNLAPYRRSREQEEEQEKIHIVDTIESLDTKLIKAEEFTILPGKQLFLFCFS